MERLTDKELLNFALENGIIDINTIQTQIEMNERKKYLEMHNYKIWKNEKDGFWHTYLPDEKKGRVRKKKKSKNDIEDIVIKYWKDKTKQNDTFRERFEIWMERQKLCGRSGNTIYKYKADYKRFFEGYLIESVKIQNITDTMLFEHFKKVLKEKEIPYKALKGAFGYVKGVFDKAVIDKVISPDQNPCAYIDLPMLKKYCKRSDGKTIAERTLSDKERKVLLDKLKNPRNNNVNPMVNFAVELSLYTGMRVGELAGLKWKNVDYKNGFIIIRDSEKYDRETKEYTIESTKNDKIRYFPMTEDIKNILHNIKKYQMKNNCYGYFVFENENGKIHKEIISASIRNKTVSKEFVNAKSIHAVRRTLNSNLRCNGVSSTVAASLLGHTQKVNEMNYTYDVVSIDTKREYIKKAGSLD